VSNLMKPLFAYLGGKARQQKWIASVIDNIPHAAYIEAFSGAASVFFAKQKTRIEILNDKDRRFPLIFKALRDHPNEVVRFIKRIEYSKAAFDESYDILRSANAGLPEWKLGCWALFQCCASFSGGPDLHSFAWRLKGQNPAEQWKMKADTLRPFINRLRDTTILNTDGIRLIRQVDRPGVLVYADPPYIGAEHRYKVAKGFSHEVLADALNGLKHAKVVLSHYHIEPYISLYNGWTVHTRESIQSCAGSTVHSPDEHPKVVEALFCKT
jgi:DNA adenine methylase